MIGKELTKDDLKKAIIDVFANDPTFYKSSCDFIEEADRQGFEPDIQYIDIMLNSLCSEGFLKPILNNWTGFNYYTLVQNSEVTTKEKAMTNDTEITKEAVLATVETSTNTKGISAKEVTDILVSQNYHTDDQISKAEVMRILTEMVTEEKLTVALEKIKGKKLFSVPVVEPKETKTDYRELTEYAVMNAVASISNFNGLLNTLISTEEILDVLERNGFARDLEYVKNTLQGLCDKKLIQCEWARSSGYNHYSIVNRNIHEWQSSAMNWKKLTKEDVKRVVTEALDNNEYPKSSTTVLDIKSTLRSEDFYATQEEVKSFMLNLVDEGYLTSVFSPDDGYTYYMLSDQTKTDILTEESSKLTDDITIICDPCNVTHEIERALKNIQAVENARLAGQEIVENANVIIDSHTGKRISMKLSALVQLLHAVSNELLEKVYVLPINGYTSDEQTVVLHIDVQ